MPTFTFAGSRYCSIEIESDTLEEAQDKADATNGTEWETAEEVDDILLIDHDNIEESVHEEESTNA